MSGDSTSRGGDVVGAVTAVAADREVAQDGHHGRAVAGSDLGQVLTEGAVADPVPDTPKITTLPTPCVDEASSADTLSPTRGHPSTSTDGRYSATQVHPFAGSIRARPGRIGGNHVSESGRAFRR